MKESRTPPDDLTVQPAKAPRGRPVRATIAAALAVLTATALVAYHSNWFESVVARNPNSGQDHAILVAGAVLFAIFGMVAVVGFARASRSLLEPRVGPDYASVTRFAIILIGTILVVLAAFSLAGVLFWQLILPGAITGVLITIAAQQALANLFAGVLLQFARPFAVGERIQVRNGAINGPIEGTVVELSITYVQLVTAGGLVFIPNSQMLAAAVGRAAAVDPGLPPPTPPVRHRIRAARAAAARAAMAAPAQSANATPLQTANAVPAEAANSAPVRQVIAEDVKAANPAGPLAAPPGSPGPEA